LRGDGEDEEEHQRAVHGDEGEVLFGEDGAVEGKLPVGPGEVEAHGEREEGADDDGDEGDEEVAEADGAVVGGAGGLLLTHSMSQKARHEWGTRIGGGHGLGLVRCAARC
jgi:hypothetical protein